MDSKEAPEIDFQSVIARIVHESNVLTHWNSVLKIPLQMSMSIADSIRLLPEEDLSESNLSNANMLLHNFTVDLQDLKNSALKVTSTLKSGELDTVSRVIDKYQGNIEEVKEQGESIIRHIHNLREEAEKYKSRYWEMQEKLNKLLKSKDSSDEIKQLRESINRAKEEYSHYVETANKEIAEKHRAYKVLINDTHDIEISKIETLKYILTQNAACLHLLGKLLVDKSETLSSHIQSIITESEIEMFNEECLMDSVSFARIEFCAENGEGQVNSLINMKKKDLGEFFGKVFKNLKNGKEMGDVSNLLEVLNFSESRKIFAQELDELPDPSYIKSHAAFKVISKLIDHVLTRCATENDKDYLVVSSCLRAGERILFKVYFLPHCRIKREW